MVFVFLGICYFTLYNIFQYYPIINIISVIFIENCQRKLYFYQSGRRQNQLLKLNTFLGAKAKHAQKEIMETLSFTITSKAMK